MKLIILFVKRRNLKAM